MTNIEKLIVELKSSGYDEKRQIAIVVELMNDRIKHLEEILFKVSDTEHGDD